MFRKIVSSIAVALVALAVAGCGRKPVDFAYGFPTDEQVKVAMPTSSGSGLREAPEGMPESMARPAPGETADLYQLTRGATYLVNGATLWVLGGLRAATVHRPSSVVGETAVYGPHTPYLSAVTWKLTVTRTDFNVFTYVLEAKDKTADDTTFRTVMSGSHTVSVNARGAPIPGHGEGTFLIEWDKAAGLQGSDRNVGTAEFRYGHVDPKSEAYVEVSFNNIANGDPNQSFNSEYRFKLQPDQSGEFQFALDINMHPFQPAKSALERWSVKSRWQSEGAGRSDVRATGGDLTAPQTVSECWDAGFLSRYYASSEEPASGYGTEASACAFATASYSEL
jgi:hypothetical protein